MGIPSEIKILVIYYSQTGQLKNIIDSVVEPLKSDPLFSVSFEELKPVKPYPFPWTGYRFFDVFPECVEEIPVELENFKFSSDEDYDFIILGWQPWFLSPSLPVTSFLRSPEAAKIMKNKPVITVTGCRNMWIMAHDKLKRQIEKLGGKVAGKIALVDKNGNVTSMITILAWMLKGQKEGFMGKFPPSGVSESDIKNSKVYGGIISEALKSGKFEDIQKKLNQYGAIEISPKLMIMEQRGSRSFRFFANFIRKKGGPGDKARNLRLRLFMYLLPVAITVLSPITALFTSISILLNKRKIEAEVEKISNN